MGSRICKAITIGKSKLCLDSSNCLSHQKQVAASHESIHGSKLAMQTCNVCLEQNQVCKCNIPQTTIAVDHDDHHHGNQAVNCSFVHAVINMVGMLIGKPIFIIYFGIKIHN